MTAKTKSVLIILGTLMVGIIIGSLATGAVFSQRVAELQALRMENGLTRFLERVIEPTDESQRTRIRAILDDAARKQLEIRRTIASEHRAIFEEMRASLNEVLTDEQKAALRTWIEEDRRRRPGFPPPEFMRRQGEPRFERAPFDSTGRRWPQRKPAPEDGSSPADSISSSNDS